MTKTSTVFKKSTFQKKNSHLNAITSKFDLTLCRSRSTYDHHLNKLSRPHIPNATYLLPRSMAFRFRRRRFFKVFYHIWAWWPSWSCDQNILHAFWLTYYKESSHEIWVQLGQWFVRKLYFNIRGLFKYECKWLHNFLHIYATTKWYTFL